MNEHMQMVHLPKHVVNAFRTTGLGQKAAKKSEMSMGARTSQKFLDVAGLKKDKLRKMQE